MSETILGILIGAGVALLGTILGSVVGPLIHGAVDAKRVREKERREASEASIRTLQDALLDAAWRIELDSAQGVRELTESMRQVAAAVHLLDLGLPFAQNLDYQQGIYKAVKPSQDARDMSRRFTRAAMALSALKVVLADPDGAETAEKRLESFIEFIDGPEPSDGPTSDHGKEDDNPPH